MQISTEKHFSYLLKRIELLFNPNDSEILEDINDSKVADYDSLENILNSFKFQIIENLLYGHKIAISKLTALILVSNDIFSNFLLYDNIKNDSTNKRRKYLQVLNFIEEILNLCERIKGEIINQLAISDYKLSTIKVVFNEKLKTLQLCLYNSAIDRELADIVVYELRHMIKQKIISRSQLTYSQELISLIIESTFSTQKLEEILILNNFNSPRFIRYTFNKINELALENSSIHRQLNDIIILEENLNQLTNFSPTKKFFKHNSDIFDDLRSFYKQKKGLLLQRIEIRKKEIRDEKLLHENEKLTLNISVSQFALLIRLFIDSGLLPKENMRKTFNFFTTHFRTPSTVFISTDSIQKKSTNVEFSTALKIKALLLDMVNIVNANHNASHYK